MEIKELIGETTDYDKKVAVEVKEPKSWCKSVSAFANGEGGTLVFGVSDDDQIVGLPDAEEDGEKISEAIKMHLDPIPAVHLSYLAVDGVKLVILKVFAGKETPYYYFDRNGRIAYHRVGNESIPCDATILKRLTLQGSGKSFDSLPSGFDFDKMSFTKLISVYDQRAKKDFSDTDYASFNLVDANGALTNAGALLADNCPIYQSRLFCTRWNGLDKASGLQDALDDDEFTGSLITLLQEGVAFVMRNSHKGWFKAPDRRIELPDYPERSVTEGLVNALIHRDYTEMGSEVHIDMFDDRLEIYSPGGMFDGIRVQDRDIMTIPSRRRNPIIADMFSRLDYMERRGSGFRKIISDYQAQYRYTEELHPIFHSEYDAFFLTLKNINYLHDHHNVKENCERNGKENVKQIVNLILNNPTITLRALAEQTGMTKRQVEYQLQLLRSSGRLQREGSTKSGRWVVIE